MKTVGPAPFPLHACLLLGVGAGNSGFADLCRRSYMYLRNGETVIGLVYTRCIAANPLRQV